MPLENLVSKKSITVIKRNQAQTFFLEYTFSCFITKYSNLDLLVALKPYLNKKSYGRP